MYVVYLAGGIASGKSTAAHLLEERGARRIDLDQLSREVLAPGSDVLRLISDEFGSDLVDGEGVLDRGLLAERAFASPDATARLEALELPAIGRLLEDELQELSRLEGEEPGLAKVPVIVEVPLLDRVLKTPELARLADEVVVVSCPISQRRVRAQGRGMDVADFDRRAAQQPHDAYLAEHADTVWDNADGAASLEGQIDAWWTSHGWKSRG